MTGLKRATQLLTTPFHARTSAANLQGRWGPWAGYRAALCFGDVDMEYTAIRNAASVYDLCPMVKYRFTGPDAEAYLDHLTVRNVAKLKPGSVHYTLWCDDEGKVLDDGTLLRHGPQEFLLSCQERHLPWMLDAATGYDVTIADVTTEIAALSLQGPTSAAVLRLAGWDVSDLRPFRMLKVDFGGAELTISRTGFTGDLGYELWTSADHALPLWDHLMAAGALHGIRPIGTDALNLARLDAGFLIANVDFIPADQALRHDRARSPFEIGLDWLIDWTKGHFNGRRALVAERAAGSEWAMVGLDIEGNVSAEGSILYLGKKKEVGYITSAAWSPSAKRSIALAQIRRPYHESADIWVEIYAQRELQYAKLMLKADQTARPFYEPARRRTTPPQAF